VPESYDTFGELIGEVFQKYCHTELDSASIDSGSNPKRQDDEIHNKLSIIKYRRPTALTSTISDERGEELTYNKIPVTDFVDKGSIANVIGHLRFKQQLPDYALNFLNTAIILMADHGPAVSGATNTIITARAGKDVVDSLAA
jgi:citrate synthase